MGWSRGGELMDVVIAAMMRTAAGTEPRSAIYEDLIEAFWNADADTLEECMGVDPAFDVALRTSGYIEDEDEED